MAILELKGKLSDKHPVQSGMSGKGPWSKQEFLLEVRDGNFSSLVAFNVWGEDKVKELEAFPIGVELNVAFNISSREWNGKWYTELRAWRLSSTIDNNQTSDNNQNSDIPAPEPMYGTNSSVDDDLPF